MAIKDTGLLTPGIRGEFFKAFDAAAATTLHQKVVTVLKSDKDSENYRWLGSLPRMREWGTGRLARGLRSERYSVDNQKYESTLEVDRDEVSDDQLGQIMQRVREMGSAAATHKDYLLSQLLENGGAADALAYDGLSFFKTTHVSGDSGNQDNDKTSNITTPADPTTSDMKAAIQGAIAAMLGFRDDQGNPMVLSRSGIVVVVPPNMLWAALEAINAGIVSQTSNVLAGAAMVESFPWLSSTDRFYVLKTDVAVRPFALQDREPLEFTAQDRPTDDTVFSREKYLYGVRARYAMFYGYWQYAVRHIFT